MEFQSHHPSSSRYISTENACYNTNHSVPPPQHEQHRHVQQVGNQHMNSAMYAVDRREDFTSTPESQWDDLVQNLGEFFFCQGPCFVDTSNSSENPRTSAPGSPATNHSSTPIDQPPTRSAPIRFPSIHLDMDEDWSDSDNVTNSSAYFFEARVSAANKMPTTTVVTPPPSKQVLRQKESIYRAPSSAFHAQATNSTTGISLYPPIPSAAGLYRSPVLQSSSDEEEDSDRDENVSMDGSYEDGWGEKRASPSESISEMEKQHQMNLAHVQELFNSVGLSL